MRKSFRYSVFLGIVLFAAALLIAETVVVKVRSTHLRKEPRFFAQTLAEVKAGDSLEKLSEQAGWVKVRTAGGLVGWIHSSAVQPKKFRLLAMDRTLKTKASAEEVALAAKGFNKQVEESYRARHAALSYAWVEKMLKIKLTAAQIRDFLKKGKLAEFGGAE
ncbi:MAG: SH3 domain-containing protein [Candidatus Aminicenantales bacterium]